MNLFAFDIGGTWIRGGLFIGNRLVSTGRQKVSPHYRISRQRLHELRIELTKGRVVHRVVVGLPGVFNTTHTTMLRSPHLSTWQGKPLANDLRRLFGVPVYLENDATLGALGEARHGAGRRYRTVAYIAIGTGIGGTCIVNGLPIGTTNIEPGHQYIQPGKTWEDLIGGRSLQRRFGSDWRQWSRSEWKWIEQQLAIGLTNIVTLWSPDIIVLGGAVVRHTAIKLPEVRRLIKSHLRTIPHVPPLMRAFLKDSAGLYGALEYSQRRKG